MRICPNCAAPIGPTGCIVCGPAPMSAEEGVRAQWHVSASLLLPTPPTVPPNAWRAPKPKPRSDDGAPQGLAERMAAGGLVFPKRAPNCYECKYFAITHEPSFPRACSLLAFKGRELPSHFLFNVSGKNCPWFEQHEPLLG